MLAKHLQRVKSNVKLQPVVASSTCALAPGSQQGLNIARWSCQQRIMVVVKKDPHFVIIVIVAISQCNICLHHQPRRHQHHHVHHHLEVMVI
jgi:hypothetical protein